MEGDFIKINTWLTPVSWLYGLAVGLRNLCFDIGILRQTAFDTPVISMGNLTVGGSGKTPHVEYLVNLLKDKHKVAVLSRGYKRKTKGYRLADSNTTMPDIGDEPYQMMQKYPSVHIAVDANRVEGIRRLLEDENTKDTEVVLLDDAFQHRYVKPGVNILLIDYHRLVIYDKLLPAGRLREPVSAKERADIVIITKCPDALLPMEYRVLTKALSLRPYQKLYFTSIAYDDMRKFNGGKKRRLESIATDEHVILLTGIASPKHLVKDIGRYTANITSLTYPDHHQYRKKDLEMINRTFSETPGKKIIITTEKDATRLHHVDGLTKEVTDNMYVLPIHIEFKLDMQQNFDEHILSHVMKNARQRVIANSQHQYINDKSDTKKRRKQ